MLEERRSRPASSHDERPVANMFPGTTFVAPPERNGTMSSTRVQTSTPFVAAVAGAGGTVARGSLDRREPPCGRSEGGLVRGGSIPGREPRRRGRVGLVVTSVEVEPRVIRASPGWRSALRTVPDGLERLSSYERRRRESRVNVGAREDRRPKDGTGLSMRHDNSHLSTSRAGVERVTEPVGRHATRNHSHHRDRWTRESS